VEIYGFAKLLNILNVNNFDEFCIFSGIFHFLVTPMPKRHNAQIVVRVSHKYRNKSLYWRSLFGS